MEYNINIPYEKLAQDCKIIDPENSNEAISSVENLAKCYDKEHLIHIYNYFFEHSNCFELLMFLLKKIDKFQDTSSKTLLIDSLLMKEKMAQRITDKDKLTLIRVKIAKVLSNTGDSQAVYPLLYCLNSREENYKIKLSCAEALGKIGDKYAVLPLINIIEDDNEQSVYVKESAVSALGMIGDKKAVEPIVSILENKKGFLNKFTFLKERALEALNKLWFTNERAFHAVEHSLNDDSAQVRIGAIEVLMNSDDSRAPNLIKKMLFDLDIEVVKNAVTALYNIFGDKILEDIIQNPQMNENARMEAIKLKDSILTQEEDDE